MKLLSENLERVKKTRSGISEKETGSLLLESLLAILILSVTLTLMIQTLLGGMKAMVMSAEYTKACFLIDNKMFELIKNRFIDTNFRDSGHFPLPFENFGYTIEVNPLANEKTSGAINEIDLDVSWPSGSKERKISVATYLFKTPTK